MHIWQFGIHITVPIVSCVAGRDAIVARLRRAVVALVFDHAANVAPQQVGLRLDRHETRAFALLRSDYRFARTQHVPTYKHARTEGGGVCGGVCARAQANRQQSGTTTRGGALIRGNVLAAGGGAQERVVDGAHTQANPSGTGLTKKKVKQGSVLAPERDGCL